MNRHIIETLNRKDKAVAEFCSQLLWANALQSPRSRPSDRAALRLATPRFDRLSQINRESGDANNAPDSNS